MTELVLAGVHKRFVTVAALDDVCLRVPSGSRAAIVGPSGSGKTTLLRVIAGFDAPDAGRITLGGEVLADGGRIMPAHRRGVGVVAQDGALFPHLSVSDNIAFGIESRHGRAQLVAELIVMVGLDPSLLRRRPDQLSGGQQQRVALARAMARKPSLMLLDEPFSALDTALRSATRKAVGDLLAATRTTTVLVTHDQAEALSFADQVAVMRDGRLLQIGTPQDVYRHPRTQDVASFLGDAIVVPARMANGAADCAFGPLALAARPPGTADGDALQILIRPEQITLTPDDRSEPGSTGPLATVLASEFAGAACNVTIALPNGDSFVVRHPGFEALAPGMTVQITVRGAAHILPSYSAGEGRGSPG